MGQAVHVRWTRAIAHGKPIDRWFAGLDSPRLTGAFAQVERIDGQWWLVVFPKWSIRRHPDLTTQRVLYPSAGTAKRHLEAWAAANLSAITRRWSLRTDNIEPPPTIQPK